MKTLLTAADIDAHRGSGPLVAPKGAMLTPGAVARAAERGIQISEGGNRDCGCDSSAQCETGSNGSCRGPVTTGAQPSASSPARTAGVSTGWSLDFDRRGVEPELFRVGGRSGPRAASTSAFGSLRKRGIDPSLFRASAARPTFAPGGSDPGSTPVAPSKDSDGGRAGNWLVTLAGADAPGQLSDALRHLESLGAIRESRHRTEAGIFQLVAVVSASRSASSEAVAKGFEQRGLTAIIHRA